MDRLRRLALGAVCWLVAGGVGAEAPSPLGVDPGALIGLVRTIEESGLPVRALVVPRIGV